MAIFIPLGIVLCCCCVCCFMCFVDCDNCDKDNASAAEESSARRGHARVFSFTARVVREASNKWSGPKATTATTAEAVSVSVVGLSSLLDASDLQVINEHVPSGTRLRALLEEAITSGDTTPESVVTMAKNIGNNMFTVEYYTQMWETRLHRRK